jgi:hypothetical protein
LDEAHGLLVKLLDQNGEVRPEVIELEDCMITRALHELCWNGKENATQYLSCSDRSDVALVDVRRSERWRGRYRLRCSEVNVKIEVGWKIKVGSDFSQLKARLCFLCSSLPDRVPLDTLLARLLYLLLSVLTGLACPPPLGNDAMLLLLMLEKVSRTGAFKLAEVADIWFQTFATTEVSKEDPKSKPSLERTMH